MFFRRKLCQAEIEVFLWAYASRTNWYLQISKGYLSYRFQFAPLSFLISVLSRIFDGENFVEFDDNVE